MKISTEQRAAIGRAVLDIVGASSPGHPGGLVGLHTACDVLTIVITVPCSRIDGRRAPHREVSAPIENIRRKP